MTTGPSRLPFQHKGVPAAASRPGEPHDPHDRNLCNCNAAKLTTWHSPFAPRVGAPPQHLAITSSLQGGSRPAGAGPGAPLPSLRRLPDCGVLLCSWGATPRPCVAAPPPPRHLPTSAPAGNACRFDQVARGVPSLPGGAAVSCRTMRHRPRWPPTNSGFRTRGKEAEGKWKQRHEMEVMGIGGGNLEAVRPSGTTSVFLARGRPAARSGSADDGGDDHGEGCGHRSRYDELGDRRI